MLSRISDIICEQKRKNWIVIGDNSSGKSELLSRLVESLKEQVYYIDSVNRYFNVKDITLTVEGEVSEVRYDVTLGEIVNWRTNPKNFNYNDSFGEADRIERLYPLYMSELHEMIEKFLGIDLQFRQENIDEYGDRIRSVIINDQKVELSSGYQAIIRIFAEVLFYCKELKGDGIIVIDEIDEFLSPKNAQNILMYLIDKFPKNRFVVTTHSADLIANATGCKMIVLKEQEFQILDCNDFSTLTAVNTLFQKIMKSKKQKDSNYNDVDDLLEKLLCLRLSKSWSDMEEKEFEEINEDKLTLLQRVIYNQIRSWK